MIEQVVCVVIVMITLIIIVGMALIVSIVRLKYIKDTAQEAAKVIKDSTKTKPSADHFSEDATSAGHFSEDAIRKFIREELIKLMK